MANVEMSSLAIIERKDKNEIYLAETQRAIFPSKIILKNALFFFKIVIYHLNSAEGMKHFSVINNN